MDAQEQEREKRPWGYALNPKRVRPDVPVKPKGFWQRPENVAVFKAIVTREDVAAAAEMYSTTERGIVWRLKHMGLATPAAQAKAGKAKAQVEEQLVGA